MLIASSGSMRIALLLCLSTLFGCAETDVAERLRECALLTEGHVQRFGLYAPTECYRDCLAQASCEELEHALCRTDVSLLVACDRRCAFECASGALIAVESVCNGIDDCAEGEDELACGSYVCADGEVVEGRRCDGRASCADRSDEDGCPCDPMTGRYCPDFHCGSGETLNWWSRCDGWPSCEDESDEAGCAEFTLMCEG